MEQMSPDGEINTSEDEHIQEARPNKARENQKLPATWEKNIEKQNRHRPKGVPQKPTCKHNGKSGYKCDKLSMQDVDRIHDLYYKPANLKKKNNFILRHVKVSSAKRSRLPEGSISRRNMSVSYYLPVKRQDCTGIVKVCRAAFLKVIGENRNRLQNLCKKYLQFHVPPKETRGGARHVEMSTMKKDAVKDFIKSFRPVQKHYCRGSSIIRQYLPSNLNVKKMWEMYLQASLPEKHVKYETFRIVFNENFNIGFDAPYTDRCSTCTRLEYQIQQENNENVKNVLQIKLNQHKELAEQFYSNLKEQNESELILSFDCQKNLVLPKIPDQAAYYKRQLYLYNLTICEGASGSEQNKTNTFAYLWTENEFAKGSNQISSAIHHRLMQSQLDRITTIKLFSDGCGGQNKNKTMITMLSRWLLLEAPRRLEKIIYYFPVVGHSFIPPDRVFGNLERQFKAESVIANPDSYIKVIDKHCTIYRLGESSDVQDWKMYGDEMLKNPGQWHFKLQKSKKIVITRSKSNKSAMIQGELRYDDQLSEPQSLNKRGKSFKRTRIPGVPRGVIIKSAKMKDIHSLLVLHYGEQWEDNPELNFYAEIFRLNHVRQQNEEASEDGVLSDFEIPEHY